MTSAENGLPNADEGEWGDIEEPLSEEDAEIVRRAIEGFQRDLERLAAELPQKRKKMARREVPKQWRSCSFLPHGFRVIPEPSSTGDHWQGGQPQHDGAVCPVCHIPLLLIWDIDCQDARFPQFFRDKLAALPRFPLYYCCRCPTPTMYKVISAGRIEPIRPRVGDDYDPLEDDEETPFQDYPAAFPRRKLSLVPLPPAVGRLLVKGYYERADLTDAQLQQLVDCLGPEIVRDYIPQFSQFGGVPILWQGHWEHRCPNEDCEAHMPWEADFELTKHEKKFLMKELAVVCDDSALEMEMHCAQIAFHICWTCLTICAEYRCD